MLERAHEQLPDSVLVDWLRIATDRRMGAVIEAFRRGWSIERVHEITRITRWFLYGFQNLANVENEIVAINSSPSELSYSNLRRWKSLGFSDAHIADALAGFPASGLKNVPTNRGESAVMNTRHAHALHPIFRMVDSCAAEFAAKTPYYYSTYEPNGGTGIDILPNLEQRVKRRQVVIGSGPIRIGQGIEFDYGCVHAVKAIREAGMDAVLMNNNPETVSTCLLYTSDAADE